jgi:hypothetical protein
MYVAREVIMNGSRFFIAEFNIGRLKAPLDSSTMREFVDFLDPVNRFAERSPGFVWRLATADGGPSSYLPSAYEDPMMAANLTVWEDLESLHAFTYHTVHTYFLRGRKQWFDRLASHQLMMWWVPAGHLPDLAEAPQKLQLLDERGPSPAAFTFQSLFDSEGRRFERVREQA